MQIIQKGLVIALILSAYALKAQFSVSIQVNHNISCNGSSDGSLTALVTPVGSTYTFDWSTGGNTATISNLNAGAYVVTVKNAAGGTVIATALLSEPEELVLNSLTELPLHVNPSGTVDLETSGGTAPYAYFWVNEANIPYSTEEDLIDAPAGIYTQTATDANGCTAVLTPVTLVLTSAAQEIPETVVKAFPNPATNELTLEIPEGEVQSLRVINSAGAWVESTLIRGKQSLSVENWPAGMYTLVLPGLSKSVKVLVAH